MAETAFRIIAADDDYEIRKSYEFIVERCPQITLEAVESGEELIKRFKENPGLYGLVITDYDMGSGKMNGLEVIAQVRRTSKVPIVMISGSREVRSRVLEYEGTEFLEKGSLNTINEIHNILSRYSGQPRQN